MPELPEVETTRRGIEPWVLGKTVTGLEVRNPALRWPVELPNELIGQTIESLTRRGKYLVLSTSIGHIIVHLGMSGSLRILEPTAPLLIHDHVDLVVGNRVLRLNDPRRFGCVLFWPHVDAQTHPLLSHLGVEPLENQFNGDYLFERSRRRKVAVKNFIMDGKIVVGVGNIYAAESLFMAGIRPTTPATRVTRKSFDELASAIREVLSAAVRQGGTTLRDFVGSDGKPGYFKQFLYVYGRQGEACDICATQLKLLTLGQRSTVYCPACQTSSRCQPLRERQSS